MLDLVKDPPVVVGLAMQRVVRRWRFATLRAKYPALLPQVVDLVVPLRPGKTGLATIVEFAGALAAIFVSAVVVSKCIGKATP